jgi:hypothetical protein
MIRVLLSLVLATGVFAGVVYAQAPAKKAKPTAEEKFKELNKAGDGHLTLDEYTAIVKSTKAKANAEKTFKTADKDNKGYLTLDEFKTIYPKKKISKKKAPASDSPAGK